MVNCSERDSKAKSAAKIAKSAFLFQQCSPRETGEGRVNEQCRSFFVCVDSFIIECKGESVAAIRDCMGGSPAKKKKKLRKRCDVFRCCLQRQSTSNCRIILSSQCALSYG